MLTDLTSQWSSISIVALYLGIIIIIAELLNRFYQTSGELTRKIVHIGTGNVILWAWCLNISQSVIILASIVASGVAIISYILPILPSVNGVGRHSYGTLFYAMSIGILSTLFWQDGQHQFTSIGILIMAYGDGMAALIGQKWGKHKYQCWGNRKSWEGSLTMTGVSMVITLIILGFSLPHLFIASIVGIFATILETFSFIGIDNLTVPVFSAILAYYLTQFFL